MCRERFGPYTLMCNQHTALACNAPSLFTVPQYSKRSQDMVAKRCSELSSHAVLLIIHIVDASFVYMLIAAHLVDKRNFTASPSG